jgi:hypothetical protein
MVEMEGGTGLLRYAVFIGFKSFRFTIDNNIIQLTNPGFK